MMRRSPLLLLLLLLSCTFPVAAQTAGVDGTISPNPEGDSLAAAVVRAAGGDRWLKNPSITISFSFVIRRDGKELSRYRHFWERRYNRVTVEGTMRDGRRWRAVVNDHASREGLASVDGTAAPDSLRDQILDAGYGRFVNDSYWLMMPLKLLDDGVHRARLNDSIFNGNPVEVLFIWFDNVGLTPGDRYRIFVDPKSHQVVGWRYMLQSNRTGEYIWDNVTTVGPITLPMRKRTADGTQEIFFDDVVVDEGSPE